MIVNVKHKDCGGNVLARTTVHEFSSVIVLSPGYIETGDVDDATIEEVCLWCEECCDTVEHDAVEIEKDEE